MRDTNGYLRLQTRIRMFFRQDICAYLYTHIIGKLHVLYGRFALRTTALLYMYRHSLCGLELNERFHCRAAVLGTHRSFFYKTLCLYKETPYIHRYLVHNYVHVRQQNSRTMTTKLTHLNTRYYTTNDAFTAKDAWFNIITNLASYTLRRSVFPIIRDLKICFNA